MSEDFDSSIGRCKMYYMDSEKSSKKHGKQFAEIDVNLLPNCEFEASRTACVRTRAKH